MQNTDYLIAVRITGYIPFIIQTEVEHAQAIVDDLLNAIIDWVQPPLAFQKSEGETLFIQASANSVYQPQTFLEMLDQLYATFALAQETMQHNISCTCQACQMVPMLGLKIAAHWGEFNQVIMHEQDDITGADAMWVRYMQESTKADDSTMTAYACLTKDLITRLHLDEMTANMPSQRWQTADLGQMDGVVYDLTPSWQAWRKSHHVMVTSETAVVHHQFVLPVPPSIAWDYMTDPAYRRHWLSASTVVASGRLNGRIGVGSTHVCHHGKMRFNQTIIDWQPFDYFTIETSIMLNGLQQQTITLKPIEGGDHTEVHWLAAAITGSDGETGSKWKLYNRFLLPMMRQRAQKGGQRMQQLVRAEISAAN